MSPEIDKPQETDFLVEICQKLQRDNFTGPDIARTLVFKFGETLDNAQGLLTQLGYLAILSEKNLSVSLDTYTGEMHPKVEIVTLDTNLRQDPANLQAWASDPE